MNAYDLQFGLQRKYAFLGLYKLGETSFFGGFTNISDGVGGAGGPRSLAAGTFVTVPVQTEITGADVNRWCRV
jgi:hypothetical protein